MGGAGAFSVIDDEDHIPFLEDIARYCKDTEIPFLGICYGFQIAVQALGGEIVYDPDKMEAGSYDMFRTTPTNGNRFKSLKRQLTWVKTLESKLIPWGN